MQAKKRSRGFKSGKEEVTSPVRECSSEEEERRRRQKKQEPQKETLQRLASVKLLSNSTTSAAVA